jgi:hypothetical protein
MKTIISKRVGTTSRRRDRRMASAVTVVIDGQAYAAADWSLGGFRIGGYDGAYRVGDRFDVDLYGILDEVRLGGGAIATVVRCDPETGELAASLDEFIADAWDQLEQLAVRRRRRPRLAGGA